MVDDEVNLIVRNSTERRILNQNLLASSKVISKVLKRTVEEEELELQAIQRRNRVLGLESNHGLTSFSKLFNPGPRPSSLTLKRKVSMYEGALRLINGDPSLYQILGAMRESSLRFDSFTFQAAIASAEKKKPSLVEKLKFLDLLQTIADISFGDLTLDQLLDQPNRTIDVDQERYRLLGIKPPTHVNIDRVFGVKIYKGHQELGLRQGLVSYGDLISACSSKHKWETALDLVSTMESQTLRLSQRIYNKAIQASAGIGEWQRGIQLLTQMHHGGLRWDTETYNGLTSVGEVMLKKTDFAYVQFKSGGMMFEFDGFIPKPSGYLQVTPDEYVPPMEQLVREDVRYPGQENVSSHSNTVNSGKYKYSPLTYFDMQDPDARSRFADVPTDEAD